MKFLRDLLVWVTVVAGLMLAMHLNPASAAEPRRPLPRCVHEDGSDSHRPCRWVGKKDGNKKGATYVVTRAGKIRR